MNNAHGVHGPIGTYGLPGRAARLRDAHWWELPSRWLEGDAAWRTMTVALVVLVTLARFAIATHSGISDTEAYYVQWARFPSLSYYDHPPLVAWSTWFWTHVAGQGAARVGPVLYAALFDALLYKLTDRLFSPRAGFYAVAIVAAVPAFFFTAFLVNPEGLLAPLWVFAIILLSDLGEHDERWRPYGLGAVIGIAFVAKYTALVLVPVTLLYALVSRRAMRWLQRPSFYLAGIVAMALASPVVVWNAMHGWPTMRLHLSERIGRPAGESLGAALARVGAGQLALFQPILLLALFAVLLVSLRRARHDRRFRLLVTASLPVLGFLLFMMVMAGDSEPHWTMVGYVPLIVAAGGLLDESRGRLHRYLSWTFRAGITLSAVLAALYLVHLRTPALALAAPSYNPNADPINETIGWDRVASAVRKHAAALGPDTVAAAAHNVLCGHIQAAVDDSPAVYCASPRRTEYDFVGRRSPGADVPVVFVNSDRYPDDPATALPAHRCSLVEEIPISRGELRIGRYRIHQCLPLGRSAP